MLSKAIAPLLQQGHSCCTPAIAAAGCAPIHTTPQSHGLVQLMLTNVAVPFQRSGGVEPSAPGRQLLVRGRASGGVAR